MGRIGVGRGPSVLGVLACVVAALALGATPALAAETCPNEQLRAESDIMQDDLLLRPPGAQAGWPKALFDQAADLQKNGVGTGIDTLRANVEYQNEQQRLIESRTSLATSLFALARLLNVDPHQPIELADLSEFFHTPAFSADETMERAFVERPEMKALASQIRATELEKKAAHDARLPRVALNASWTEQGTSPGNAIPVYDFGVGLDVPLYTGGRIRAQAAIEDLDRFQAGVGNNIEVITAQDELARANDNQIVALYRYNQARADLAHATGQMESLYAK